MIEMLSRMHVPRQCCVTLASCSTPSEEKETLRMAVFVAPLALARLVPEIEAVDRVKSSESARSTSRLN